MLHNSEPVSLLEFTTALAQTLASCQDLEAAALPDTNRRRLRVTVVIYYGTLNHQTDY